MTDETKEPEEPKELPGKVYETAGELCREIEEKWGDAQTGALRIWGQKLVSEKSTSGRPYIDFVADPDNPQTFFDAWVHHIKYSSSRPEIARVSLNILDRKQNDPKKKVAQFFNLNQENIGQFRIEIKPKGVLDENDLSGLAH